jgi:hypothetical protein
MAGRASKKPTKKRGRPPKNKGLGDTIENITETTGIKKAVKLFSDATGLDCGCDARKEKLNQMFPYRQPTECMSKDQFDLYEGVRGIKKSQPRQYVAQVYPVLAKLHSSLFNHRYNEPCTCSPKEWDQYRADIEKLYQHYKTAQDANT